jgi:ankyrin repeat protein
MKSTPLHHAARGGAVASVKFLLDAEANADEQDEVRDSMALI